MAILFQCPHCGDSYRFKDESAGKTGRCRNPACAKVFTIPAPQVAAVVDFDAEALAAAAFLEEAPVAPKEEAPVQKIKFSCQFCAAEHEVDSTLEGKNMRCPECGKIIRVPKVEKAKPADWRNDNDGKPTLAKRDVPKLEGATEVAKVASLEALKQGGAFDVEDDEEPEERRARRIKQLVYGSLTLLIFSSLLWYYLRSRTVSKQEKLMDVAVREIEDPQDGSKRPEFHAAIHRYAGEYHLRVASSRSELDLATNHFKQALGKLQKAHTNGSDRAALLMELSAAMTILGGDSDLVKDEKRLPWSDVQRMIQQPFQQAGGIDVEQREWGTRRLTHAFVSRQQGGMAYNVARYAYAGNEAECAGRIGLELLLLNQKETAQELLKKAPPGEAPAMTAFRLALNPDQVGSKESPLTTPPPKKGDIPFRSRLAYTEALAFQGKIQEARELAERPTKLPLERARALLAIVPPALDIAKDNENAGAILENLGQMLLHDFKEGGQPGWLMVRVATLSARVGKAELAQKLADAIVDESIRSWARLEILRFRWAAQPKQKADDSALEPVPDPTKAQLATLLAYAELARHNAAAGETAYASSIEKSWAKGILRPFGYAGTALGNQDRGLKP